MRGKSHRCLGHYLVEQYMPNIPKRYVRAFLLGCIEPDRNPATYLKGSIRRQWLRGHNYGNAQRYMQRISSRLERKDRLLLVDYYTLGKLIHYTADAFTYAHNDTFPTKLSEHRDYEADLQDHFIAYLEGKPEITPKTARTVMETIHIHHRRYIRQPACIRNDSHYAVTVCCCVLSLLLC